MTKQEQKKNVQEVKETEMENMENNNANNAELICKVTTAAIKSFGGKLEEIKREEVKQNENLVPLLSRLMEAEIKKTAKSIEAQDKTLESLKGKQDSQSRSKRTLANNKIVVLKAHKADCENALSDLHALNMPDTQISSLWGSALYGLDYKYENAADVHAIAEKLEEVIREHPATIGTIAETGEYSGNLYKNIKGLLQDFYNLCGIRIDGKPCYVKQTEVASLIHGCVKLVCKGDKSLNLTKNSGLQIATAKQIEKALCKVLALKIEGRTEELKKADSAPVKAKQAATAIIK